MTRNKFVRLIVGVLIVGTSMSGLCLPQMPPKSASIIRNDATAKVTIEIYRDGGWVQMPIDGQKYRLFWNDKTSMWDFSSVH
jgi:hypothetical protein